MSELYTTRSKLNPEIMLYSGSVQGGPVGMKPIEWPASRGSDCSTLVQHRTATMPQSGPTPRAPLNSYTRDMEYDMANFGRSLSMKAEEQRQVRRSRAQNPRQGPCHCDPARVAEFERRNAEHPGYWYCMCSEGRSRRTGNEVFYPTDYPGSRNIPL